VHDVFPQFLDKDLDIASIADVRGYLNGILRNLHLLQLRRATRHQAQRLSLFDHDSALIGPRVVWLPGDHLGDFDHEIDGVNTPENQIAGNDNAVGLLIETVANSPFAKDTLIVAIEDDACDGPDHVDAHRSIVLVAGPYVRRHALVSTRYTTVSVVKTSSLTCCARRNSRCHQPTTPRPRCPGTPPPIGPKPWPARISLGPTVSSRWPSIGPCGAVSRATSPTPPPQPTRSENGSEAVKKTLGEDQIRELLVPVHGAIHAELTIRGQQTTRRPQIG
jgi:hypothetical protein